MSHLNKKVELLKLRVLNLSKVHYIAFMVKEIVLERRRGRERGKGSGRGGLKRKIVKLSDQYR